MGCGEFLVKYILFFANLFFALSGLALVGIGIAVELKASGLSDFLDSNNVFIAPIFTIVVGCVVFLIAFLGCCGAIRESNCMLVTYSIFMIILMILKIALASLIFVGLDGFLKEIPRMLQEAYSRDPVGFQAIESTFTCCGTTGVSPNLVIQLPNTCCATPPCNYLNAYSGCNGKVHDFFNTFGLTIGISVICIATIELVAVIFGLCLANTARNKDRRARY